MTYQEAQAGPAWVWFQDWAGTRSIPVEVIGQAGGKLKVRTLAAGKWAGRNQWVEKGHEALVPAGAVRSRAPRRETFQRGR